MIHWYFAIVGDCLTEYLDYSICMFSMIGNLNKRSLLSEGKDTEYTN